MLPPFAIWLIAGATLIALEMVIGAYAALSLGIGCVGVSIVEVLAPGFSIARNVPLFGIMTIIAFVALRLIFRRKGDSRVSEVDINRY